MNIEKLNKSDLQKLLKSLKFYRNVKSKLGNRGKRIFDRVYNGKSFYKVEYFSKMDKSDVWDEAKKVYKKSFGISLDKKEVLFIKNDSILGGIIVFKDDEIVDLSFSKIKNSLKKE
ncbi:hypothetical protein CSB08_00095 [Candidatus Gracilibacteria bacterium]|nr:MAG: hypothetical protein CSB08_00095 [Candidatus Gracilibacteria bacterium]PIE85692.1 MAG: hypothetical protein CSA08_00645 [Candidatus Gracilibacteria bacterium]